MDCHDVLLVLLDYQQGRLAPEAHGQVRAHLDTCAGCAAEDRSERELTQALERRLPQYAAPLSLKRRLAAKWPAEALLREEPRRWFARWIPAAAVALALVALAPLAWHRLPAPAGAGSGAMVAEAVNDHIRLVQSERPLEIESGGIHQVIPWFSGRLEFSPTVRFSGDADFPLRGGAIGYFVDRRAAALVYGRRLHPASVFIFRADRLPWPRGEPANTGRPDLWRTPA